MADSNPEPTDNMSSLDRTVDEGASTGARQARAASESAASDTSTLVHQPRGFDMEHLRDTARQFVKDPDEFTRDEVAMLIQSFPAISNPDYAPSICTICQKEMGPGSIVCLGCPNDLYHAVCLLGWFTRIDDYTGSYRRKCPNCNMPLYKETYDGFARRVAALDDVSVTDEDDPEPEDEDDEPDTHEADTPESGPLQPAHEPDTPESPSSQELTLYQHALANTVPSIPGNEIENREEIDDSSHENNATIDAMHGWIVRVTPWDEMLAMRETVQPHGTIDWQKLYAVFMGTKHRLSQRLTPLRSHPSLAQSGREVPQLEKELDQGEYLFDNQLRSTSWRMGMHASARLALGLGRTIDDLDNEPDHLVWWDILVTYAQAYDLPCDASVAKMREALHAFVNSLGHGFRSYREEALLRGLVLELSRQNLAMFIEDDDMAAECQILEEAVKGAHWYRAQENGTLDLR
ncbi:uncharacterized protein K452DRAFT_346643 [Aplosporella prunicola CBS 121167]|uniref:RING-type domain-containing protein n=1 Tax=Aplosporella prunicola CBS 121167 TaxID=1176127 RepID=A0A6A6AVW3_9PEZI|nr:uncharacterized protein K452DRAFT_346643 [Aplosporella prunicola CBS 121167]KAF2135746.1 hypothetical protein K452DRAFT_346643 [Aplosporella prunicola CBS 121167]